MITSEPVEKAFLTRREHGGPGGKADTSESVMKNTQHRTNAIHMKITVVFFLTALGWLHPFQLTAAPLGSAFTYQGKLEYGGQPASGLYDFQFALHDAVTGGNTVANTDLHAVGVTNGLFTVQLDFGANVFIGAARWLGITVSSTTNHAPTALTPRQLITPAPYSLHADKAAIANSVAANGINSTALIDGSVTIGKLAAGAAVKSLNGLTDTVSLTAGPGLSLSTNGSSLHLSASGAAVPFGSILNGISPGNGFSVNNASSEGLGVAIRQGTGSGLFTLFGLTGGLWGDASDGNGVLGSSKNHAGLYGVGQAASGQNYGGYFVHHGSYGAGVYAVSDKWKPAYFEITNPNNPSMALHAYTVGSGAAVSAQTDGSGDAGNFSVSSLTNTKDAVHATTAGKGHAVSAQSSGTGSALRTANTGSGPALEIGAGTIKVSGAGLNTPTSVFIHRTTNGNMDSGDYWSRIDNALTDGDPNALLIVTGRYVRGGSYGAPPPISGAQFLDGHWYIHSFEELRPGYEFTVLVIKR